MPLVIAQHTMPVVSPALSVVKQAPATANTGELITYRVIITNTGNALATGIVLTEAYDTDAAFVNAVPFPSNGLDMWLVPQLWPGGTWAVDITVRVSNDAGGWLINNVDASFADEAGNAYPAVQAQNRTLVIDPLMSVSKDGPAQANPGQAISYWLNYTNSGTDTAHGVVISDILPAGTTYLSSWPAGTLVGSTLTWTFPAVAPGSYSILINVTVSASASGTLYNYATLDYGSDVRAFPQEDDYLNTLIIEPEMQMSKEAPATANTGQQMTYWLNYTNVGSDRAYNVVITESYPAGVTFVGAVPAPSFGNNVWNLGSIGPGGSGCFIFRLRVLL
jgi:uncharacterized repeat protein (TIGR01451 family)